MGVHAPAIPLTGCLTPTSEYVDSVAGGIDQLLTVVYALLALSILIALMGIGYTLSAVDPRAHPRARAAADRRPDAEPAAIQVRWESGTDRRLRGAGRSQPRTGPGLGHGTSGHHRSRLRHFSMPAGQLGVVLLVGSLLGVLAGMRPARRAARLDVFDAVNSE